MTLFKLSAMSDGREGRTSPDLANQTGFRFPMANLGESKIVAAAVRPA
jgi:hypothetical protein